jgi:hypothetical protein
MFALFFGVWAVAVVGGYRVCPRCLPGAAAVPASGALIVAIRVAANLIRSRSEYQRRLPQLGWRRVAWLGVGALVAGGYQLAVIAATGAAPAWDLVPAVASPVFGLALLVAFVDGAQMPPTPRRLVNSNSKRA